MPRRDPTITYSYPRGWFSRRRRIRKKARSAVWRTTTVWLKPGTRINIRPEPATVIFYDEVNHLSAETLENIRRSFDVDRNPLMLVWPPTATKVCAEEYGPGSQALAEKIRGHWPIEKLSLEEMKRRYPPKL